LDFAILDLIHAILDSVVQFVGGLNGGGNFVVGWSAHGFDLVGWVGWVGWVGFLGASPAFLPVSRFWDQVFAQAVPAAACKLQLVGNE
jgi:hypothetical protein